MNRKLTKTRFKELRRQARTINTLAGARDSDFFVPSMAQFIMTRPWFWEKIETRRKHPAQDSSLLEVWSRVIKRDWSRDVKTKWLKNFIHSNITLKDSF